MLQTIYSVGHEAVFSPECWDEWRRHGLRFAQGWLRRMISRGKIHRLGDVKNPALRGKVAKLTFKIGERNAVEKDFHLVEAALISDRIVISCDEEARGLFGVAAGTVVELKPILWMNPEIEEEDGAGWLSRGAKDEATRRLGGSRAPG